MKPPDKDKSFLLLSMLIILILSSISPSLQQNGDASVMLALKSYLKNPPTSWTGSDPCNPVWEHVQCSSNRITRIQIGNLNLQSQGTLPSNLSTLTELTVLEMMGNSLGGPLPSLAGLSNLLTLNLHDNHFSYIPPDIFKGMTSLAFVYLDKNPFATWQLPESLRDASSLREFSANFASLSGPLPGWLNSDTFPSLVSLHLAGNNLTGGLPDSFSGSSIQSLWMNGQTPKMNGSISVLGNMTALTEVWLNMNSFTGPLPDFSRLTGLQNLTIRDNQLTGPVPDSLTGLKSLIIVNLTNNWLQGPAPKFGDSVQVDMAGLNQFCSTTPGSSCSYFVNVLLDVAKGFGYPLTFGQQWEGNDPCNGWKGISCSQGNITVISFMNMGLSGVISPSFSMIPSLQKLLLANNSISGAIPDSLTNLTALTDLDVSNNKLSGQLPHFRPGVLVKTTGNPDISKNGSTPLGPAPARISPGSPPSPVVLPASPPPPGILPPSPPSPRTNSNSNTAIIVGSVVGGVIGTLVVVGLGVFCVRKKHKSSSKVQSPNMVVIHPRHSGEDGVKITIAGSSASVAGSESRTNFSSGPSDIQVVEAGNMLISIQVLRDVTNNFSQANILGQGGFGTVYKGELYDGTKIAVKRMESGLVTDKGLTEFQAEIAVLTKVRHRHLVALLGYCLDGNEKLLVYEYMPQGTLSKHLFNYREENIPPLEWTRRLIIALDVARGVEYLHGLAHRTFIHRDLKPSNILLGDDMRAKVADFGLVRLAPEGKASIATKLAGTFGYLAPEYAVTGRVTTKIDVFSFGVILMEMITGRKALDESRPEDSMHLVTWFRRMYNNKDTFRDVIDTSIEINEETLASVTKVAELASYCTAREPYQRPDMGHAVNVLSSLVELWKPAEANSGDAYDIDFDMTLPQALKRWQEFEGSNLDDSSLLGSNDNTQTSIPARPTGFADSLKSADGR